MKLRETETEKPQKDYASAEVVGWDPNISTSSKQRQKHMEDRLVQLKVKRTLYANNNNVGLSIH